jgi:hypothetical protein
LSRRYSRHPIVTQALSYALGMMYNVEPMKAATDARALMDRLEAWEVAVYPKALIGVDPPKDALTMVGDMLLALEEEMERKPWLPEWAK